MSDNLIIESVVTHEDGSFTLLERSADGQRGYRDGYNSGRRDGIKFAASILREVDKETPLENIAAILMERAAEPLPSMANED